MQVGEVMQRLHGIAGQALPSSMLARSPTIQGLAETLAAIPPVDPQRQGSISRAPYTASQRAAGVPCAAMQEGAAHSYLVSPEPLLCALDLAIRTQAEPEVSAVSEAYEPQA